MEGKREERERLALSLTEENDCKKQVVLAIATVCQTGEIQQINCKSSLS